MVVETVPATVDGAATSGAGRQTWDLDPAINPIARPKRWDRPFGGDMTEAKVADVMERPEFALIDAHRFPANIPVEGIVANDMRIVTCKPGQLVLREGDYGHSAFLVLTGKLRVVITPSLSDQILGRGSKDERNLLRVFAGLLPRRRVPEAREVRQTRDGSHQGDADVDSAYGYVDVLNTINQHQTKPLIEGDLFGELAALTRQPRRASVFAEDETTLLEIRWQGLRELRRFDQGWQERIDGVYRENALKAQLRASPLFADLPEMILKTIAHASLFESYGSFDWHHARRRAKSKGEAQPDSPVCHQGDYPDGLLLIGTGFARVWVEQGSVQRTLTYLTPGDSFGLHELYQRWHDGEGKIEHRDDYRLETGLSAIGYVDIIRIPADVLEKHLFPSMRQESLSLAELAKRPITDDSLIHWAGDEHIINGTQTMLIDLDRCVRCDECVRACAATHQGNPRFLRDGPVHDHWMVAHACMHCMDPVCMIDCPTGAIHRERETGAVVINAESCIGCATCADSCPYGNIRMVELCDKDGRSIVDETSRAPISRATKCDLCVDNFGGPACVRACPQDALQRVDIVRSAAIGIHP